MIHGNQEKNGHRCMFIFIDGLKDQLIETFLSFHHIRPHSLPVPNCRFFFKSSKVILH